MSELATVYAALILADEGIEITADKLQALTSAANVTIEPFWFSLFAKVLGKMNVDELLSNVGSGSSASAPSSSAGSSGASAATPAAAAAPVVEEESGEDMGFGLFD